MAKAGTVAVLLPGAYYTLRETQAPPVALLSNVSLAAVPEPVTWALMLAGFGGLGAAVRARRKIAASATA